VLTLRAQGSGQVVVALGRIGVQRAEHSTQRCTPDLSFDADPKTGVLIYDTYFGSGSYGLGGTSASCPMMAGLTAVIDQGRSYLFGRCSRAGRALIGVRNPPKMGTFPAGRRSAGMLASSAARSTPPVIERTHDCARRASLNETIDSGGQC
jgi:hypothetical protein